MSSPQSQEDEDAVPTCQSSTCCCMGRLPGNSDRQHQWDFLGL
jgi:hypothetical protein